MLKWHVLLISFRISWSIDDIHMSALMGQFVLRNVLQLQVRHQYTIQHDQKKMVIKELELLDDEANVYKLIGPLLVKQDLVEAKPNVSKRIQYITTELRRLDGVLKSLEEQ